MTKVIISGSTSGIGKAISQQLLTQGHDVIGLARDHSKFQPISQRYHPYTVDFADIDRLPDALQTIYREYSTIDALICCAGYGQFNELEQFSIAQIQRLMDVNFVSQVLLIKTWLPQLKQQRYGKIIIIGSEAALQGQRKGSIYCASKFALRGFCQSLRYECNRNHIAVTIINPGLVKTPFFDTLDFQPGCSQENHIEAQQIAEIIDLVMKMENNCVVEEINLQPLSKVIEKTLS